MHSLKFFWRGKDMAILCARIFIDFWNLQLSINERTAPDYRLDWKALSAHLIAATEAILGEPLKFEGTNIYLSYAPGTGKDKKLRHWATTVLDGLPGVRVVAKERKAKSPPICPSCHLPVENCPHCGEQMRGTVEKGIDTAIVTDMISLAWEDAWDVAILVTSDRDFIPTVEFLATKGHRIINARFPPKGAHLARTCWASVDLGQHLAALAR
jgi:uncharacterized LabA/DUF88 family protein